ncbi:4'-phosphopantetheinyl transferase superfamily protein [Geitlerinema splendidum]|nr:4'-phosphopantetheinyl transferase superfamily protein [Geitlerinema splendidum]
MNIFFPEQQPSAGLKGIGVDIAPIAKMVKWIERYDRETLNLIFTPSEIERCQAHPHPPQAFAVCFATKEAVGKALSTGLVGIDWHEIEANLSPHQLTICLHEKAIAIAEQKQIQQWLASWCHWEERVLVWVVAQ